MRRILSFSLILAAVVSCGVKGSGNKADEGDWTSNAVIYELNIRQATAEGTLVAAEAKLPELKDLGVDVVWLMPLYPIGVEGRKGTLGSYYAIKDYCDVNPEFGTLDDFDHFVAVAHDIGMKVIIDWVANHTSPDHPWVTEKDPDWYVRDAEGKTVVEYDWTDIAKLNYDNADMRVEMEKCMRFWMDRGIDGFRCDVASQVPADFWSDVFRKFRNDYPRRLYFLAEGEETWLNDAGFDCTYAWRLHHLLNDIAQGKADIDSLLNYLEWNKESFGATHRLTFTSNHDENSWAGTEFEREGKAADACAVLCFTLPASQPLIYTGQEIGLSRRLAFFEKDPITDWSANEHTAFYKTLVDLKHNNPALAAGERGGKMVWWEAPEGWVAFHRQVKDNMVIVLANFGTPVEQEAVQEKAEANDNRPQGDKVAVPFLNLESAPVTMTFNLPGEYRNVFTGEVVTSPFDLTLAPGEYMVLTK